ncbi:thiamine pyrophosphate-binding protein, partial [Acetobacter persici]|uniref:thiamine pyrophosphate-binding protein n=1 Tax=Acetobacter persici TaxID=1076596 RepID=UPI001BABFB30
MQISSLDAAGQKGMRRGAAVLLEILRSEGVDYIFGNPGTTELPLMDALLEVPNVSYILGLQEASVVAMADGYAQAARRPGFLNLHTAGGLGHGMGNLLNASVSQTPLVVTAGQQDSRHTISDPLLFGDLVQIARPAVKWAQEVAHADQLPVLLRRAFHDSMAAPTGPVFLSLPMDVMEEMSGVDIGTPSVINRAAVAGGLEDLAKALTRIAPGRIALIAGDEVYASDAAAEVAAVAECLGAPVYGSSWPSRVPFSTAHPLWCGNLPTQATAIAERLSAYDAIFALGGKSLITILYTEGPALPPGCAVYQMSSDVRDLGRTFNTPLSVVGDIKASLQALLPLLSKAAHPHQADYAAQAEQVAAARRAQRAEAIAEAKARRNEDAIPPRVAAWEAVRAIGPDVAIVDEAIATSSDVRLFLESTWPGQYSFLRGGALGWGMPAAVGASLGLG